MTELEEGLLVHTGNITAMKIDAVVNAANSSLMGGGGVDGAIHSAGGPAILDECRRIRDTEYPEGLPPGEAVITTAGNMKARYVIHTVGPVWKGGDKNEEEILGKAYTSSLRTAEEHKISSIAFPAISTGIYGFPKERAAETALSSIREWRKNHLLPEKVILVFFKESDAEVFRKVYEETH